MAFHSEWDPGLPKKQQQKLYGLNEVSGLLSISSFLSFVWSGDRYFPIAHPPPPQVVISQVFMFEPLAKNFKLQGLN